MAQGSMVALAASVDDIDTTDQLMMFEAYQKVFVVNGSILRVADFINTQLATSAVAASASLAPPLHGTVLTGATSSASMVCDVISSATGSAYVYGYVTSGTFVSTDTVTGTNATGSVTEVSFALTAAPTDGPHWYSWVPYPGGSSGSLPEKAYIGCLYRGRAVLAGNPTYPYQWYMSRQANPWDWAYMALDAQSAVAGGNADAGEVGDIITALIPYKDDFLIIGCVHSLWVLRGDPAAGGSLDEIDLTTGIIGPFAYCWDNQNNLYFFGSGGIYRMGPNFAPPENLSISAIPDLIEDLGISQGTHRVTMGYDRIRMGLLISVVTLSDGTAKNYWYDLRMGGLFPLTFGSNCGPYSLFFYEAQDEANRGLLFGGKDGYIRIPDDDEKNDDNGSEEVAIDSWATMGPIQLGQDADRRGRLQAMTLTTGTDTDTVGWELFSKETAEEIVDSVVAGSTAFHSGTLSAAGRIQRLRPRTRAAWLALKLRNNTIDETWQFEKGIAAVRPAGEM